MVMGATPGGPSNYRKRTYHDRILDDLESSLQAHSVELAIARGTPGLTKDGTSLLVAVQSLLLLMTQVCLMNAGNTSQACVDCSLIIDFYISFF